MLGVVEDLKLMTFMVVERVARVQDELKKLRARRPVEMQAQIPCRDGVQISKLQG